MREFNVSTVNDVIDARKRKFLAKYSVSECIMPSICTCRRGWISKRPCSCARNHSPDAVSLSIHAVAKFVPRSPTVDALIHDVEPTFVTVSLRSNRTPTGS